MTPRPSKKLVTFQNAFSLGSDEAVWPAGDYTIETQEFVSDTPSGPAHHEIITTLVVHPRKGTSGRSKYLAISHIDLDAALAKDRSAAPSAALEVLTS